MNQKLPNKRFLKIEEIYAFIAEDGAGEGIMGFTTPDGRSIPMIGADLERVNQLKPIADAAGVPYEIRYFTVKK